jgi:hypothetical protein
MVFTPRHELDRMIVLVEFRVPMIGKCAMEAVPSIEAPTERPLVA